MTAPEAKEQLEAAGYVCMWAFDNKGVAKQLQALIADKIEMALDIENGLVDDAQMQWLLTDAMRKKAKRGNRK